jgi:cytochrome c oxidase subunit 2
MGFIKGLNLKKAITLFSMFILFGTNMLFAQGTDATPAKVDWLEVGYYVLMFIIACLGIAVIGKILKVYDLSLKMQGKKGIKWNNFMAFLCLIFLIVGLAAAYWSLTVQGSMTLPEAASKHGVDIDNMFLVTSLLTLTVFFITQILLFGFSFYYRKSEKRKAYYLPHNNTIEKVWTVIPAIVLTVLVVFGFFTWQEIENSTEVKGDLNVEITGHQFGWYLRYPGKDGKLGTVNYTLVNAQNSVGLDTKDPNSTDDLQADTLVFPVNKPIRLNIRAHDVIHSVFMPHFRLQQNAVPGLPTFFKFIPTITTAQMRVKTDNSKFEYLLYCNKICGGGHYNMQKVVRIVTEEEYLVWIAKQKPFLNIPAPAKPEVKAPELKVAALNKDADKKVIANRLALNN